MDKKSGNLLASGEKILDLNGNEHIVITCIGGGGQGNIYSTKDPSIAVKINKKDDNNELFKVLLRLPIPKNINITLPIAILKEESGYVMSFLEKMISFEKVFGRNLLSQKDEVINPWLKLLDTEENQDLFNDFYSYQKTGGKRRRLLAYLKSGIIMARLHTTGLVYCDFSTSNVFISQNKEYNNVYFIDADNLNFQEYTKKQGYYTPGFAAPEVISGGGCTYYSDNYSLILSFFWNLIGIHPFKGKRLDEDYDFDMEEFDDNLEEKALNGILPWIRDKEDSSNYKDNGTYSLLVRENSELDILFDRTFSKKGKEKKLTRPTSFELTYEIIKELDRTIKCKNCEMEYVIENKENICPWCDSTQNKILKVNTFKLYPNGKKNKIWNFMKEIKIDKDEIPIPVRIVEDFLIDRLEEELFKIKFADEAMIICYFNEEFEFKLADDKNKKKLYEKVKIEKKKNIQLFCDKKNSPFVKNILIEVEVI